MSVTTKTHKPGEIPITSEDHHRRFTQYRDAFKNRGGNCDMFEGFRCLTFPYGAAAPSTCPDSCIPCTEQFVPTSLRNNPIAFQKVELHDDKMAASVIQSLVESTQSDYSFVRDKIQTHGNAIAKRWQKRSAEKREEILRNAVPDMPLDRNADIEQIFEGVNYLVDSMNNRASREEILKQQQTPEEPFLAPCLNIESLREDPMRLLALMHHRSHAHSSEWISFDKEVIQIYFNTGKLRRAYNPQCVVVQGPHFGSLVQWSENEAHWWQMIGYPLARHLLRVQSKIANLLRKVTEVLLDRAAEQAPQGRDFWNHLVSTSFKQEGCFVAASAYYSQVFAPPPRFDPLRIYKLLETRCRAAIDEAQLVQADPLYLRRLLRQVENSTMFALMSEKQKRQMLYMYSIGSMVKRNIWGYMGSVAREMVKYPPQERQGILHLSKEYEKELRKLEAAVRVRFEVLVNELGGFFATSRTFQYHFREGVQITDPEIAFRTDPLFWALVELAAQIVDSNWPAVRCFSFIEEHLAKSSAKERARIDQTLYDHLADMAFTDELLSAIKAHRSYTPLARNSKKATELYEKFVGPSISGIMIDIFHAGRKDAEIHDALQEFSRAPIPKKASNKEKLEYNIALNEKFKEYWHIFRAKSLQRPEVVSLGSEDEAIKRKFREYSEGEAYIFEAKQNAIKTAIAKEGRRLTQINACFTRLTRCQKNELNSPKPIGRIPPPQAASSNIRPSLPI